MAKFHVKKDDTVRIIAGESKGEEGKVLEVYPSKSRALVEGVNMVKRHTKPNATHPNGGIVEQEAALHLSNLMVVNPKTGEATRTGRKVVNGKIERYFKEKSK